MRGPGPPPPRWVPPPPTRQRIPQNPARGRRAGGRPELSDSAVVTKSWGMAFATLISRITGFIRIVLLAAILGAPLASAFSVANQLPNLIAALVLEATFTAIFVPVLARAERDDPDGGEAFVRRLVTLSTTLLLATSVLAIATAPVLVDMMLGSDPQVNRPLTTAFAYLLLPQVLFYGLSSVFMAILNNRNVFGPTAWAPVCNNLVAILTLVLYLVVPGELSLDPVRMGDAKLLVLGVGTTLGVAVQAGVLLVAIRRERIRLRPLWGIDDRLKQFGTMAAAMLLYVLISQLGLVIGNRIASGAAASGPAIYNYAWLVLMLPFGMIGVTVLTVVMPRLSRHAAANDTPAVLADFSLATRLTLVTLIPIVAIMTVGGPAMGSALFAYGNFGSTDAGYLGVAISMSAFTLIPYALVLIELRVFYAREQPWTPILLIIVITIVKIIGSVAAPHVTSDPEMVAAYLGLANGLGFLAGAVVGYVLLRANLNPPGGRLVDMSVVRTILVTTAASLIAGLVAQIVDQVFGLESLTENGGAAGSVLRLILIGLIMLPILGGVMLAAHVPDAEAALQWLQRRLGRDRKVAVQTVGGRGRERPGGRLTYSDQRNSYPDGRRHGPRAALGGPPAPVAGAGMRKGPAVTDKPAGSAAAGPDSPATTQLSANGARSATDDFQPDIPTDTSADTSSETVETAAPTDGGATTQMSSPSLQSAEPQPPSTQPTVEAHAPTPAPPSRPPSDWGGDPTREPLPFAPPRERVEAAISDEDVHLIPGATIARGRYRLLVFHGGPPHLQFWQALDTALERQVALTFVDPEAVLPDDQVQEILSRTLMLSRIDMPGVARVLDVATTGSGGLIVSEWIRGASLAEVADTSPSPIGGARAMQSLAAAAEVAHRSGVVLSIDHPSRVRVSIEGDVALAFPATMPDATPEDDVRGIGAALYTLLINRWPLPESGVRSGIAPAELDAAGQPVEPRALNREIPFQISAAAARAVQEGGGIRSAPTLLNLLQQATAIADRTELIAPVDEPPPLPPPTRFRGAPDDDPEAQARRKKGLIIGISVGAGIILLALIVLASILGQMFGDVGPIDGNELGLNAPDKGSSSEPTTTQAPPGNIVKPSQVAVFSPGGEADSPGTAALAIDGNPTTGWSTDTYSDAVPFPNFKTGVGLMLQLPQPTTLSSVTLTLPSTGTVVQVRSSQSPTPSTLEDTTPLGPPTPMKPGANTIKIDNASPTSNVLVWISTLGSTDGKSRTEFSEVTLKGQS